MQSQQTQAVIDGDPDFARFDVLLHMALKCGKNSISVAVVAKTSRHSGVSLLAVKRARTGTGVKAGLKTVILGQVRSYWGKYKDGTKADALVRELSSGAEMETILVVDDEPTVLGLCQRILKLGGYNVLPASGGEEALRLLQTGAAPIDLALLDVMMPGMNGVELAHRIQGTNPSIPIVLMTGYSINEIARIVGDHNPYRIMWKPFKAESMLRMIENALGGSPIGNA